MIKQIFEPYHLWEDYVNGMWRKETKENEDKFLLEAIEFTGDHLLYGKAMLSVVNEWPITCRHNLSDKSINRKAFIGHAACSISFNCPEYITRMAWKHLTERQRIEANKVADIAILEWERRYKIKLSQTTNSFYQLEMFYEG